MWFVSFFENTTRQERCIIMTMMIMMEFYKDIFIFPKIYSKLEQNIPS